MLKSTPFASLCPSYTLLTTFLYLHVVQCLMQVLEHHADKHAF